ncbi:deoxyribonuclease-2-beta-like [Perca fluviatilis]|uniref:deoxyribonuclease-2-beta-like n=1 Tax=Perca fluviatilis TaxID=8168 RepID=UPI0019632E80|nr:deoxyribonuclease-2-beta-like [Perca fluviatilis]
MWRIFLMVSLLCWSADGQRVTCRDHNNGEVDWYIIYKAPKLKDIKTDGLEYIYIDSKGKKKETSKDHNKLINAADGVLANTLRPILKPIKSMTDNFGFITYNDQPPGCNAFATFGHSKGVVMMDKTTTGVWLSHSTPQFPFKRDQNKFYPTSGAKHAQTFICVTFNYKEFKDIGQHLLDIAAFPFDHHIPTGFHEQLIKVTEKDLKENPPGGKISDLTSPGQQAFVTFAKKLYEGEIFTVEPRFDGDLYLTIAEHYQTNVRVQTWGCQDGRERSYCGKNRKVINIESVKPNLGNREVKWKASNDHSKWCVAEDNNNDLICIADVNRAVTQYKRPGGALCFRHKEASKLFEDVIDKTELCPSPTTTSAGSKRTHSSSSTSDTSAACDSDSD